MFQRGWQHLGFHHLECRVELFEQFRVEFALRISQLDGQRFHADRFVGKHGVEAEIEEIGADVVASKGVLSNRFMMRRRLVVLVVRMTSSIRVFCLSANQESAVLGRCVITQAALSEVRLSSSKSN